MISWQMSFCPHKGAHPMLQSTLHPKCVTWTRNPSENTSQSSCVRRGQNKSCKLRNWLEADRNCLYNILIVHPSLHSPHISAMHWHSIHYYPLHIHYCICVMHYSCATVQTELVENLLFWKIISITYVNWAAVHHCIPLMLYFMKDNGRT